MNNEIFCIGLLMVGKLQLGHESAAVQLQWSRGFSNIQISAPIFNNYSKANQSYYGKSVRYSGKNYSIPASVFTNSSNWEYSQTAPLA